MKLSLFSVLDHYPDHGRTLPAFYGEVLGQAELADDLGYDTFFIAEHHFHPYGVSPDPSVLLSAMAQRTKRLRLGTAVSALAFRNPVQVAESYAMLDVLSGGRLTLGVGSGYLAHEFAGFAIDAETRRERFEEAYDVLDRLLAGERVTAKGSFFKLDDVAINVAPVQAGGVPLQVATLTAASAERVGRQGRALASVPYASMKSFEEVGALVQGYRHGLAQAPQSCIHPALDDVTLMFHTFVAGTDAEARRRAAAAFDLYVDTRLYARKAVYDDIIASGLSLMGGVETVAEKLITLGRLGVRHIMTLHNFGGLADAEVRSSMRLLMEDVKPRVERALQP